MEGISSALYGGPLCVGRLFETLVATGIVILSDADYPEHWFPDRSAPFREPAENAHDNDRHDKCRNCCYGSDLSQT